MTGKMKSPDFCHRGLVIKFRVLRDVLASVFVSLLGLFSVVYDSAQDKAQNGSDCYSAENSYCQQLREFSHLWPPFSFIIAVLVRGASRDAYDPVRIRQNATGC